MKKYLSFLSFALILFVVSCTTSCTKNVDGNVNNNNHDTGNGAPGYAVHVTTIAGQFGVQGDADGKGNSALFWNPTKMVYDNRNNTLYVADGTVIRSIDTQNNVSTYLPFGKINNFDEILDIDVTKDATGGSLYFITKENGLYKIEPDGNSYKLTNIADRTYEGNETGALNTKDHFDLAHGLATGVNGDLYFFNTSWFTIHHIAFTSTAPYAGNVEPFAGKPAAERGGDVWSFQDGAGEQATFGYGVTDMCADASGSLYVADFRNELVRKVTAAGVVTSLFQYGGGLGIDIDGPVTKAKANRVDQVSANANGTAIFFTTYGKVGNNLSGLRVVKPGLEVSTLVGKGTSYGDGSGNTAGLGEIGGIAATADGKTVYVSEVGNKVIRKVTIE